MKDPVVEKPHNSPVYKKLLVYYVIFSVIICIYLAVTGFRFVPGAPAQNPFYTENINYPPRGTERVALFAFFLSSSLYFVIDYYITRGRSSKIRIFSAVAGALVIIAAVEISCFLFLKKHPTLHRPHPVYLWQVTPGISGSIMIGSEVKQIQTDRYGFRNSEISRRKPEGAVRIMILGDSSAFGYQVDQDHVFSSRMQEMLNKEFPGRKIEVINAAVPGYTTYSSLGFFRDMGVSFEPDIVLISHNNDPDLDWDTDKNRAVPELLQPVMKILYKSSIYMIFRKIILNRRLKNKPFLYDRPPEGRGTRRVPQEELKSNLEEIMAIARGIGARVMIISMPRMEDEDEVLFRYRKIMESTAEDNNGVFLDLYRRWDEDDEAEELFIDDMHPNEKGHERLAGEVIESILENRMIKRIPEKKGNKERKCR